MNKKKLDLLLGPVLFALITLLLKDLITLPGAQAIGTLGWMIFWWIKRPVNMAVTGMLPVVVNAIFTMADQSAVISNYASEMIILIFGSTLLIMTWGPIGLDRRIALKCLSIIGPSIKSQVLVWMIVGALLSGILPNAVVGSLLAPICVAMLAAVGQDDVPNSQPATLIFFAIAWGIAVGGMLTPMGGMMNVVAINLIEQYTGEEVAYISWIIKVTPFVIVALIALYFQVLRIPNSVKTLDGTKEFFAKSYKELGNMKYEEKLSLFIFVLSIILALVRPLYEDFAPGLKPAYIFFIFGFLNFFLLGKDKKELLTWEVAEQKLMWKLMITFAGGSAIGTLISKSGAADNIAQLLTQLNLHNELLIIAIFTFVIKMVSETTSSTTAAAVVVPIMITLCTQLDLNAVPYAMIMVFGFSGVFFLPISVNAIYVGYGLNPDKLLKHGLAASFTNIFIAIVMGYALLKFWPFFSL